MRYYFGVVPKNIREHNCSFGKSIFVTMAKTAEEAREKFQNLNVTGPHKTRDGAYNDAWNRIISGEW